MVGTGKAQFDVVQSERDQISHDVVRKEFLVQLEQHFENFVCVLTHLVRVCLVTQLCMYI